MLVLSRREGEELIIDGNIRIQIVRIEGNKVRIGVSAPLEKKVLRAELVDSDSQEATIGE